MTIDLPHETAPQAHLFTCWPSDGALWDADLEPAQAEFACFLKAVIAPSATGRTLDLTILAATDQAEASARKALGRRARVVRAPFGDVWARDTGPVFLRRDGEAVAVRFRFNGWGGKYELPGDDTVGGVIATLAGARQERVDLVAEGGALEFDGEGTLITTRQCLLNRNRNPGLGEAAVEARLKAALGSRKSCGWMKVWSPIIPMVISTISSALPGPASWSAKAPGAMMTRRVPSSTPLPASSPA